MPLHSISARDHRGISDSILLVLAEDQDEIEIDCNKRFTNKFCGGRNAIDVLLAGSQINLKVIPPETEAGKLLLRFQKADAESLKGTSKHLSREEQLLL